jgi:subtilisin family serine protease
VLTAFGDTSESTLHTAIHELVDGPPDERPQIIGLSLGGPVMESPFLLRSAVAHARAMGVVIVASAGNDGTCVPQYPAALEGVVSVGALGPDGPAPWTNYGDWVNACAPGTGLVSTFFPSFDGAFPMQNTVDPDAFAGWARWSGTSFAAPVAIAALAREMVLSDCSATEAVAQVVEAPHLMSIPCLGTVINL